MKLHHLNHFLAVARHGSLHRAAVAIGVAQSALSRSLSELEASLGAVLLERSRQGSTLTLAGKRFLVRATAIEGELRRSREEARQHLGETAGHVTIAMSPSAQMLTLPHVLRRFRRSWPSTRLTIRDGLAETFEAGLIDGTVDFYVGICPLKPLDRGLVQRDLAEIDRIVIAREDSRWRSESSLKRLHDAPWIRIGAEGRVDHLSGAFVNNGLAPPTATLAASSMLTVLLLLQSVDALALVPRSWADVPPAAGVFVEVPVQEPLGSLRMCTLRRTALPLTPAAEALFDLVTSAATPGQST